MFGKCVMTYKNFSSNKIWLPEPPLKLATSAADLETNAVADIAITPMSCVDGETALLTSLGVNKDARASELLTSHNAAKDRRNADIRVVWPSLKAMELKIINQHAQRTLSMETTGEQKQRYVTQTKDLRTVQEVLLSESDKKRGYIMWLDFRESGEDAHKLLSELPQPLGYPSAELMQMMFDKDSGDVEATTSNETVPTRAQNVGDAKRQKSKVSLAARLKEAAAEISSVARTMLENVDKRLIGVSDDNVCDTNVFG